MRVKSTSKRALKFNARVQSTVLLLFLSLGLSSNSRNNVSVEYINKESKEAKSKKNNKEGTKKVTARVGKGFVKYKKLNAAPSIVVPANTVRSTAENCKYTIQGTEFNPISVSDDSGITPSVRWSLKKYVDLPVLIHENFDSGTWNAANFEIGSPSGVVADGGYKSTGGDTNPDYRGTLRTIQDFVGTAQNPLHVSAVLKYSSSISNIAFLSIRSSGLKGGAYNEPANGIAFRLHNFNNGQTNITQANPAHTVAYLSNAFYEQPVKVEVIDNGTRVKGRLKNLTTGATYLFDEASTYSSGSNRIMFSGSGYSVWDDIKISYGPQEELQEYASGTGTLEGVELQEGLTVIEWTATDNEGEETKASFEVWVNACEYTTWQGNPPAWSHGEPNTNKRAVIATDYTGLGFVSKSLKVNSASKLTIQQAVNTGDVLNEGEILMENNANFLNTGAFTAGQTSKFRIRRYTQPIKRYAYVNWSSPFSVSTQTLKQFSYGKLNDGITPQSTTGTLDNRFYRYQNNSYYTTPPNETFIPNGVGYFIRAPNDFTTVPQVFQAEFEGKVPNSGFLHIPPTHYNPGYQLVGNPYPSAISIEYFFFHNWVIDETIYIWNSATEMNASNQYEGTVYNTYTPYAGANPAGSINGYIPVGQAFYFYGYPDVFYDDFMRVTNQTGVFNKAASIDRFWLKMTSPSGKEPQMLLAFHPNADEDFNSGYDGRLMQTSEDILYTKINGEAMAIDAHGAFNTNESFSVFINTSQIKNYTLSLHQTDGVFQQNSQPIYVRDKITGAVTNLKQQSYSFTSLGQGEEDRFEVFFATHVLETKELNSNQGVQIYSSANAIGIKSEKPIAEVSVHDFSGRLLTHKKEKATSLTIPMANNTYVTVSVTLENGTRVTKKIKTK